MADPARYLAGVGIAMATTFMSALGMTLQKLTHQRLEGRRETARRKHRTDKKLASFRQPLWVVGLVLMAASALISLAVFSLVGQSVASAFASITIVWSLMLSVAILRERITTLDLLVATMMIVGTVLAVYFGSRGSAGGSFLSLDDILDLQRRPAAYAGWAVFGALILGLGGYSIWQDRRLLLGTVTRRDRSFRATIAARCVTAGLFSGIVGFLSKAIVSVFGSSASGAVARNLARWEVWVFLLLLPSALVLQVAFLNSALRHFPAAEAVPLYQSQVVIWGVIYGWTLYDEGAGKSGGQVVGFLAGIVVIVAGICLLLAKRRPVPPTLTVLEAVKALAVGELLVQVTALRRAHTAPGSLAGVVEAAQRRRGAGCGGGAGCDASALASLEQLVPVQTSRGTAVRALLLIRPQDTTAAPVSPRELLAAPTYDRPARGGGGSKPGDDAAAEEEAQLAAPRRRVPPALRVNVLLPAGYSLQSEPARDRRYRATASVATVSELLFETELPGVPELAAAAVVRRRGPPPRARGPAAAQLSLFIPPGLDYMAAPLTFIPPPVAAGEVGAGARTIGGSVRRVYPSLRRIGLAAGSPIPVAAAAAAAGTLETAGDRLLPLRLPPPPPPPPPRRPARDRVLSAPADQLQLPPRAAVAAADASAGRQRAATHTAAVGASAACLSPVAEEHEEAAEAAAVQAAAAAEQSRRLAIGSPPPDFVRRARSLSAATLGQLSSGGGGGGGGGSGLAAVPTPPVAVAEGATPPSTVAAAAAAALATGGVGGGGGGGEELTQPAAATVLDAAPAAAAAADVQPPTVVEEGGPSSSGSTGLMARPPRAPLPPLRTDAAEATTALPAAVMEGSPPFPSLISVPLAVIQTLPGIDVFLLTSFLRAEASAEFETALVAAAEEKRRAAAEAAAKRQAAGRRWWGRRRPPPPPPEQVEALLGASAAAAPTVAAAATAGAGGVTVAVAPKTPPPPPLLAAPGAAPVVVVATATTTTTVGAPRRRRSLSDVHSALLPVLAPPVGVVGAGGVAGGAVPPSPLPRGHMPALSSEPVLALAQLHALGSPGALGHAAGTRATAGAASTVAAHAGHAPPTARTPTGGGAHAARQRQPAGAGEETDVTGGDV